MNSSVAQNIALLLGRVLLAAIFLLAGVQKITGYAGTAAYMESMGVPSLLLPVVILVEIVGGLAILVGFQTRIAAVIVGGFTLIAGVIFHFQPADQMQMIMFMKNLAIAGGFLALFVSGAGGFSIDGRRTA